jgi:hypothetical protein
MYKKNSAGSLSSNIINQTKKEANKKIGNYSSHSLPAPHNVHIHRSTSDNNLVRKPSKKSLTAEPKIQEKKPKPPKEIKEIPKEIPKETPKEAPAVMTAKGSVRAAVKAYTANIDAHDPKADSKATPEPKPAEKDSKTSTMNPMAAISAIKNFIDVNITHTTETKDAKPTKEQEVKISEPKLSISEPKIQPKPAEPKLSISEPKAPPRPPVDSKPDSKTDPKPDSKPAAKDAKTGATWRAAELKAELKISEPKLSISEPKIAPKPPVETKEPESKVTWHETVDKQEAKAEAEPPKLTKKEKSKSFGSLPPMLPPAQNKPNYKVFFYTVLSS